MNKEKVLTGLNDLQNKINQLQSSMNRYQKELYWYWDCKDKLNKLYKLNERLKQT